MDQRQYLTSPDIDVNIMLWHEEAEAQMGERMRANGDFQCMVEEGGEFAQAWSEGDDEQIADALCDFYVANFVMERLLRREHGYSGTNETNRSLRMTDDPMCAILQVNGAIANYLRKPKTPEKTEQAIAHLVYGRTVAKRTAAYCGIDWVTAMNDVLDILDERLRVGYKMNKDGSAIKAEDTVQ